MILIDTGLPFVQKKSSTRLVRHRILNNHVVASTGNVTSGHISLEYAERVESLQLMASSVSGTADVKAEYETSWEASLWDNADDNADITASTLIDKANNPEGMNVFPVSAPLNKYIRIKITGVAANPADTVVTAYLIVREGFASA